MLLIQILQYFNLIFKDLDVKLLLYLLWGVFQVLVTKF